MKRFSIGLVAVLMALGFAAFTTAKKVTHKGTTYFYRYNGIAPSGENTATNYSLGSSQTGCNDLVHDMVCVIETSYAPDGSGNPQFPTPVDVRNDGNIAVQHWKPE